MADTAYGADHAPGYRGQRRDRRHPQQPVASTQISLDKHLYAQRHRQFRRVAGNYLAIVTLAAIILWIT